MTDHTRGRVCSCGGSIILTVGDDAQTDDLAAQVQMLDRFRMTHDRPGHDVQDVVIDKVTITQGQAEMPSMTRTRPPAKKAPAKKPAPKKARGG